MRPYVVKQGDYLTKLAHVHGFDADEVWGHPKNEELRAMRPNPELLAPGDVILIPVLTKEGLSFTAGTTNRYRASVPRIAVDLVFEDEGGPLAEEPYEVRGLRGADGEPLNGQTDADGRVHFEVPVTVREIEILFPRRNVATTALVGDMDPGSEESGIRKRLENLGYLIAGPDLTADREEVLRGALVAFQRSRGLPVTGKLDEDTRKALLEAHGA